MEGNKSNYSKQVLNGILMGLQIVLAILWSLLAIVGVFIGRSDLLNTLISLPIHLSLFILSPVDTVVENYPNFVNVVYFIKLVLPVLIAFLVIRFVILFGKILVQRLIK